MERKPNYLHCGLCGMEFEKVDTVCAHGCPMGMSCSHVRCPNCGYEFPEAPRLFGWVKRLFTHKSKAPRPSNGQKVCLERLQAGERGRLLELSCPQSSRRNTLTVFGLTPGTEITLLQRHPSFVLRVGETEVGLDKQIARQILVEKL
jgi:Fe2+ transport system protein FeoA